MAALLVLCLLIWVPVLFFWIDRRGLAVLCTWLLIAPVATNVIQRPRSNPFFSIRQQLEDPEDFVQQKGRVDSYLSDSGPTVRLNDFIEPTRLLFGAFFVLFALQTLTRRRWLGPFDATERAMAVFSILIITSALQSRRIGFGLHTALDAFIVPFLGYFIARRVVSGERQFRTLVRFLGYAGIVLVVAGMLERLTNHGLTYRLTGPFPGKDLYYIPLVTIFFLVVLDSALSRLSLERTYVFSKPIRWFLLVGLSAAIALTWTRGLWMGYLSGLFVLLILGHRFITNSKKFLGLGVSLLSIPVIVLCILELRSDKDLQERVGNERTIYVRLGAWGVALEQGITHPLFGVGLHNMRAILATNRTRVMGTTSQLQLHNGLLAIFAETGILGLCAYSAILLSIVRMGSHLYRYGTIEDKWKGLIVIATMVSYLVPSLFSTILYVTEMAHVYPFVGVGAVAGLYRGRVLPEVETVQASTINKHLPYSRPALRIP